MWRELRKIGAAPVSTGVWTVPDTPHFSSAVQKVVELAAFGSGEILVLPTPGAGDHEADPLRYVFRAQRLDEWQEFSGDCAFFEVLDRLASLGKRVLLVRGNAERELVSLARGESIDIPDDVTPWAAGQRSPAHIALLAGLEHPVTIDIKDFGSVLFCHGTPRSDEEVVLVDSSLERWADVFSELPEQIRTVVCGHTHMPFIRLVDRRLVINPGSVGMPYG
ncbi:Chromate resistance protein ChrB [Specibacter sp. RAF43]|uniref:Chromate resistance protein ChrB n=1 Tax=Specibacter sp. RAF43 TaxID=3233057 RepID=UPI003F973CCD